MASMSAPEPDEVDPKDFLRALLNIDPEDAERVRDDSPATRPRKPPEGPYHDYGDDDPQGDAQP
jgi:hypothetical protein